MIAPQAHLTDEQMQIILDMGISNCPREWQEHLNSCSQCQEKFSLYQKLYGYLSRLPFQPAPTSLREKVMDRIYREVVDRISPTQILLLIVGIASSLFYLWKFTKAFVWFPAQITAVWEKIGHPILGWVSEHTRWIPVLVALLFILLLVEILDEWLWRKQRSRLSRS